ncbi:MAG: hypothetical protein ACI9GW_000388 [Halieaceae bacterium]|jgi:hypothetical protein
MMTPTNVIEPQKPAVEVKYCPIRTVGGGAPHHFFGYYNKSTWNKSGQYFLSNQVSMMTGDLNGEQVCSLGFFDLLNGDSFHEIGQTSAWNWQMGCQLQWIESDDRTRIIYNKHAESSLGVYPGFCSVLHDVDSGESRTLPLPIYVAAPNGQYALCVDYSRFQVTHETIGYSTIGPEPELDSAPAVDGIYSMDIETGDYQLLISLRQLTEHQSVKSMEKAIHWVTHLEIAPNAERFLFLHRWTERVEDETCFLHRLYSMAADGSDLRLLECTDHPLPQLADSFDAAAVGTFDYEKSEYQISHPAWRDSESIVVWGPHNGKIHYHLYDDRTGVAQILGAETLTENGHMTYSADGRWLLTDTYPDSESNKRDLILYDVANDTPYIIGQFFTPPDLGKHNRCDLHPRWSPDNKFVSIDSVHDGSRQQYIIDVSAVVLAIN